MNTKIKRNSLLFVAGLFVLCALCLIFTSFGVKSTAYADSANPYLQVTCGSENRSDTGWTWNTDESYNGTLTLNNYNGQEISIGGVNNGKVDIVLVGNNKITVTAPYGNRALNVFNVSTLTFKGSGSLTIDFQHTATTQDYMYGIYIDGAASAKNNGNLTFDESCTVTVKVYGEVAEKNGLVDAIFIRDDRTGSGNVTVGENATLNIDLKCDKLYQTYGIYTKGNIALDGTVDIKMVYTGTGSGLPDTWRDVYTSSSYATCSIGKNATITSVCPGSSGSILVAFPLVANGNARIEFWTAILSNEQYFENDECLVRVWDKASNNVSFKNYSYAKLVTPLTFEDKAEYDVPATVYGDDGAYSSIALSASGGGGEYTFSIVSAADGNTNGVKISSTEPNKIYVSSINRGVSEATEITVKVTDKCGYSKDITVNIGAVAAPTYSATVDNIDFGTVRVGYSSVTQVPLRVVNTGTGKINCNLNSITLEGENASSFELGYYSNPGSIGVGKENTAAWSVKPKNNLAVGSYTATVKFSGTPEYSQYGTSVVATATVTFVVTEHDFDTSTWEHDETKHWNPCKDLGCTVHGNEAAHDKNGEIKNAVEATFDTDGNSGDKYCSVCGAKSEDGTVIPAGKYIRESSATMTPAAITDKMTAKDLAFTSGDSTKYTVGLYGWRVFDLTDESLNTDDGKYPKDSKFIANHEYAIEIAFAAVGSYEYEEMHDTHCSTFTVNGQPTQISTVSSLAGSKYRRITLTAADTTIPVTVTAVQISFSELNVERGGSYTFTATVSGTGAFDNSVIWSVEGADSSTISVGGILSVTANESSSTITVKATSKQDNTKYAAKTVTVRSLITVSQKGVEKQYKVEAGGKINLTAETAASGYHFKEWQVSGAGTFADKTAQKTEFTVPHENVTITSAYELHTANGEGWLTDSTKHYHVCSCGTEIGAAPHTFGEWTVIKPATEDEKGSRERSCSVCSYKQTEEIDKLPHTHNPASAWTNDATGHWHACSGCNEKLDFAEHTPDRVAATETEPVKCSVCDYIITPALGHTTHTPEENWRNDETNHWHKCTGCEEKLDKAAHTFGEWNVIQQPTEMTKGTKERVCSVCEYKQTDEIPVLGHTHTAGDEWLKNADEHWHKCTGCEEILDKAAHTYGDWTVTKQPTTTESGEKERTCSVCGYKQIETVPMTGEFEKVAITVTGGNGGGSYNLGDTVTVTANAPAEGKKFDGWYVNGEKVSSDNSYTFTVTEGITLEARYVSDPTTPTDPEPDNKGLSGGAIAGITIACVFVAGIGGFAIFWFVVKKKSFAELIAAIKGLFKKK